jgi:hypothetical protein
MMAKNKAEHQGRVARQSKNNKAESNKKKKETLNRIKMPATHMKQNFFMQNFRLCKKEPLEWGSSNLTLIFHGG